MANWRRRLRQWRMLAGRLYRITRLAGHLLLATELTPPLRLRLFFERAGGAFIKLGQILALRYDLLPVTYTDELLNLLSRVAVTDFTAIRPELIKALGAPPEQIFRRFDRRPIASASIAQVYRAETKDGQAVAVKVRRPGVVETFATDFVVVAFLVRMLRFFHLFRIWRLEDVVDEFVEWTSRELDFRIEAENAATLYRHSAAHPRTVIPRVFPEYSSERVLVSEYVSDIKSVEQLLPAVRPLDLGFDLTDLAYYFIFDSLRQYFVDGFFHADPHPANLFVTADGRLGYFDFGIIGRAGPERATFMKIIYAVAERDFYTASKHFFLFAERALQPELDLVKRHQPDEFTRYQKVLAKVEEIMIDNFQQDLAEILAPWYQSEADDDWRRRYNSSAVMFKLLNRAEKYGIYLPREIVLFFRTLVLNDMVALKLCPNFDMVKALKRFFAVYPPSRLEQLIQVEHHAAAVAPLKFLDHLSFEELLALKEQEEEELNLARQRLADLAIYYAERYDEIRKLLKEI